MELKHERVLVTSALIYANGPVHIGHIVEYIQTDIFVRFLRLIGRDVIYICGDDTHGTPIEINAQRQGVGPEELIEKSYKEHTRDFKSFRISFDNFYSTNTPENKRLSDMIFSRLKEAGHIYQKEIELTYCEHCRRFLPDRYVKGKCPRCGADEQYGDVCEKCNSTYEPADLIEPYCTVCKSRPVKKASNHYFFRLSSFSERLREWITSNDNLQQEIKNFVLNWIKEGLKDWCISRDGPYFGFRVPGEENKYYYVWLDAPIGYIASTENYCKGRDCSAMDYWESDRASIIHFIGKDIIYFHFLFWPAMLMGSGLALPESIVVHGFLNVAGEKMSKSRGTFFTAEEFANAISPELLRFYYASSLGPKMEDINLDFWDFQDRINNELVANIANFAYRVLSFANTRLESRLKACTIRESPLCNEHAACVEGIRHAYDDLDFRAAVRLILRLSSAGNKHFQDNAPWRLINEDAGKTQEVVSLCANLVKDIAIALSPIMPDFCSKLAAQLGQEGLSWDDMGISLGECTIPRAEIILRRLGDADMARLGVKRGSLWQA